MRKIRILIPVVLAFIITISSYIYTVSAADTGKTPQNMSNVVILVKFKDDTGDEFNADDEYGDNNWEEIKRMYNDTSSGNQYGIDLSFKKYIAEISNEQVIINNCFPQDTGTSVDTYTLSKTRAEYDDDYYIIQEIITATKNGTISIPSTLKLDNRESEVLDNLTIIFQVSGNVGDDEMLYPHKSIAANSEKLANRVYVRCYNFLNSYSVLKSQYQGVITHEFMHSMGFPDLYRYNGNGSPVGAWDIMSQVGRYLQYPLTYFRQQMGWVSINKITSEGNYTLNPVTTRTGNQAYIIETPMSDSEFFVVEYRVRDTSAPASLAFESKVPQTGLIVYRVNTSVEEMSNSMGNDYIYVFRPNETSLTSSAGDILYASVSPTSTYNPRTSIGSTDLSKEFTDNTIFYSDGRNSGISITNVEMDSLSNSLSFDIDFADYSSIDMWEKLGDNIASGAGNISIDTVSENEIYTAFASNDYPSSVNAYMWNGSVWNKIGNTVANSDSAIIKKVGTDLYLFYQNNGIPKVAKFGGSSWIIIGSVTAGTYPQACDILTDGADAYITYTLSGEANELYVDKITASGLVPYAAYTSSEYIVNPKLSFYNNSIYAVMSLFDGSNTQILKAVGNTFTNIKSVPMTYGNAHGAVVSDGKLYCFVAKNSTTILSIYDGISWVDTELVGFTESYSDIEFTVNNGIPYIARISGPDNTLRVYRYEDNTLNQFGGDVVNSGNDSAISIIGDTVYAATSTGSSGIMNIRYKSFETSTPTLESISIKTLPSKTDYIIGESLITDGMTLELIYSDGSKDYTSTGFTCSPVVFNSYGLTAVNVSYGGKSVAFNVNVDCSSGSHVWDDGIVTSPASCVTNGEKTFTCGICAETRTETIPATGIHSWNSGEITTQPTCSQDGTRTFTCGICAETRTETIPATGEHIWDNGTITTPASCTQNGVITYTCTVCNTTKTETTEKLLHSIRTDIKQADCTNGGYSRDICTVCNTVIRIYNETPATGHIDDNEDGICDICSSELGGNNNCNCICHSTGFMAFIYKILRVFYKIFGIKKTCECGIEHY